MRISDWSSDVCSSDLLKVVDLLAEQGTRLVAIDNVHVILTASGVARRDTLDAFRFLMSAGNVPLVVAGLDVARQIFADDVELAYRSIILKLPLWQPGEPAQRLIRDRKSTRLNSSHQGA